MTARQSPRQSPALAEGAVGVRRGPGTAPGPQRLVIPNWHPTSSPNAQNHHWRTRQKRHHADRDMAWASARLAEWAFVSSKVRLTVTLVYPRKYRVDADNLAARCKGLIDGLKDGHVIRGWFIDDSTEWLELVVRAEVRPGVKQTELLLEQVA